MKKMLLLVAMTTLLTSTICGGSTLGPPVAGLEKGQLGAGVDYSYNELCLEMGEGRSSAGPQPTFYTKDFKTDVLLARLAYGVKDWLEAGLVLGAARGRYRDSDESFSGDCGVALGVGAKMTFHEQDRLRWGGLFQINWYDTEGTWRGPGWSGDAQVKFSHIKIAVGPTYELWKGLVIYGGPFWQCIDGDKTYEEPGWSESYDIDACSYCGAYVGGQLLLGTGTRIHLEYQLTDDNSVIGLGLVYAFSP